MSRSGKEIVGGDVGDFVRSKAGEVAGKARGVAGNIEDLRDLAVRDLVNKFRVESGARRIDNEHIGGGQVAKEIFAFPEEKTGIFAGAPEQPSKKSIVSLQAMMVDTSQRISGLKQNVDRFLKVVVTDFRLIEVPSSRTISKGDNLQPDRAG